VTGTSPALLFIGVGLLLVAIGWPLAARRVRPNRWYGLRVPATFADERVWYDANALAGRDLVALGLLLVVLSVGLPTIAGLRGSGFAIVAAAVAVVGSMIITIHGWRAANRLLRDRRGDRSAARPADSIPRANGRR
jgi:uncharacterized membrane protein